MGLGSTAKKIQTVADTAEKLYAKVNEMRQQVDGMRETVTTTEERVERLEADLAEQRALLAALAEEQGIDPESVVADVDGTGNGSAAEGTGESGESTAADAGDDDRAEASR